MVFTTEQHRLYQTRRRNERLAMALVRLGGKCVRCGATEELQFDHIVPGSRSRKIYDATNWSLEHFLNEVDKCQLLCDPCHRRKTAECFEYSHGERHPRAKLTENQVRTILQSSLGPFELAAEYGVSKSAIISVRQRRTWKHVTLESENEPG